MKITDEEFQILNHTATCANGLYCGNSEPMRDLVRKGLMTFAGRKSFVPDDYFALTLTGRNELRRQRLSRVRLPA